MNKSKKFIILNLFLVLAAGLVFYFYTKPLRTHKTNRSINLQKESGFRQQAKLLDSLYKKYAVSLSDNNESAIAENEASVNRQITLLKQNYTGNSAPALLATKLIRNYQFRIILKQRLRDRNSRQIQEINRIKTVIAELTKRNQDFKTKNQMVEQTILGLP